MQIVGPAKTGHMTGTLAVAKLQGKKGLQMFENKMLRKIFGPKKDKISENFFILKQLFKI